MGGGGGGGGSLEARREGLGVVSCPDPGWLKVLIVEVGMRDDVVR